MTAFAQITSSKPDVLQIDIADLQTIVRGELGTLREHLLSLKSLGNDDLVALKNKLDEAEDMISWQVANLAQDLEALQAPAPEPRRLALAAKPKE
ncbi:hypothetical protein V0R48_18970 [Pseudomonas alcaligenes]|uniref:hypothetical protein n=1 Tax=Aquipseudomonas alcaligenes TaxID=43263 RepID=UPI002E7C52ED|nr:hypothetical protein [Pseudomonas alcaligenes]MEE1951065.1 hypothetical protein [Pseudomonas alcaligenes]